MEGSGDSEGKVVFLINNNSYISSNNLFQHTLFSTVKISILALDISYEEIDWSVEYAARRKRVKQLCKKD